MSAHTTCASSTAHAHACLCMCVGERESSDVWHMVRLKRFHFPPSARNNLNAYDVVTHTTQQTTSSQITKFHTTIVLFCALDTSNLHCPFIFLFFFCSSWAERQKRGRSDELWNAERPGQEREGRAMHHMRFLHSLAVTVVCWKTARTFVFCFFFFNFVLKNKCRPRREEEDHLKAAVGCRA